jgi:glycosyltransferase involved in cell wall biosynthesis
MSFDDRAGGARTPKVAYVVKRYPRYSETFIVNEILAHEAVGLDVEIFSLLPGSDTHFQDAISRVRAPVNYLSVDSLRAAEFWEVIRTITPTLPGSWAALGATGAETAREICQALMLARAVRAKGVTHLHAHFGSASATVARLASRFTDVPYTFTAHAKDIFHESVQPADLRCKLADASAVVTVSDYNVAWLREHYGAAAARVRRVYNGMDFSQLTFRPPRPGQPRPPLILGIGRLVEKKGFASLVDACAVLARRGREFSCLIVGTGELEADLLSQVARLGLQGQVQLVGPRPQRDVFQLLRDARILAVPCVIGADGNRDGLPTVLLEAMALGTACVSTDVTGIPEIIRDGETGLLVPQRDANALAHACERLLDDSALAHRLAVAARQLVEQHFDARHTSAQLRQIFESCAASFAASPVDVEVTANSGAPLEVV